MEMTSGNVTVLVLDKHETELLAFIVNSCAERWEDSPQRHTRAFSFAVELLDDFGIGTFDQEDK